MCRTDRKHLDSATMASIPPEPRSQTVRSADLIRARNVFWPAGCERLRSFVRTDTVRVSRSNCDAEAGKATRSKIAVEAVAPIMQMRRVALSRSPVLAVDVRRVENEALSNVYLRSVAITRSHSPERNAL